MYTMNLKTKIKLNYLIAYYRKNTNNEAYLSKNFILDENNHKICDVTTLSKLENNKIVCRDEIYFSLLEKLNKKYQNNENLNILLQNANQVLLIASENNDVKTILNTISKFMPLLSTYKAYIVYEELLEIYDLIYAFYKDGTFKKEYIDKYFILYALVEEELRPIFLSIAYQYYSRSHIDSLHSLSIIEKSKNLKINMITRSFLLCAYYTRNNQNEDLYAEAKHGLALCKNKNNTFYPSKFYSLLAYYYRRIDTDKAMQYMHLCIQHFDYEVTPYKTLVAYYTNMAHLAFDAKKYHEILNIYYKVLYDDLNFLQSFFYLLIEAIHEVNEEEEEIKRILNIVIKHSENHHPFHKAILNIYEAIYLQPSFARVNDAIEALYAYKAQLENEGLMKFILLEEIRKVCEKNNRYQLYIKTMKIFQ